MMQDEVVNRRKWMTSQQFLDLLGATNLIPGPNSTEMAIHVGYARAGRKGLIVAGAFLDGANAASVGLIVGVVLQLGLASIVDSITLAIFLLSLAAICRFRVNSTWLIVGGAAIGIVLGLLTSLAEVALRSPVEEQVRRNRSINQRTKAVRPLSLGFGKS
jgi:chromate transporter